MNYGFIGLGNLGRNLAGSLLREGFQVTVTDVNPSAAENLLRSGAKWCGRSKRRRTGRRRDHMPAVSKRIA